MIALQLLAGTRRRPSSTWSGWGVGGLPVVRGRRHLLAPCDAQTVPRKLSRCVTSTPRLGAPAAAADRPAGVLLSAAQLLPTLELNGLGCAPAAGLPSGRQLLTAPRLLAQLLPPSPRAGRRVRQRGLRRIRWLRRHHGLVLAGTAGRRGANRRGSGRRGPCRLALLAARASSRAGRIQSALLSPLASFVPGFDLFRAHLPARSYALCARPRGRDRAGRAGGCLGAHSFRCPRAVPRGPRPPVTRRPASRVPARASGPAALGGAG